MLRSKKCAPLLKAFFPKDAVLISLDRMLAAAEDEATPGQKTALKTNPPKIFVSTEPAILLLVDGEPVRAPIPQTSLEVIVNANWDLFFDKAASPILPFRRRRYGCRLPHSTDLGPSPKVCQRIWRSCRTIGPT